MGEFVKDLPMLEDLDGHLHYEGVHYTPWKPHTPGNIPEIFEVIARNKGVCEDISILTLLEDGYVESWGWEEVYTACNPEPDQDSFTDAGIMLREWCLGHVHNSPDCPADGIKAYAISTNHNEEVLLQAGEKTPPPPAPSYHDTIPLWGSY